MRLMGLALLLALVLSVVLSGPALAGGMVGTGTAASCTGAALATALSGGGTVTFNCGADPVTIAVTGQKTITSTTTIDGGGLVTISGGGASRVFYVNSGVTATLQNLTITAGKANPGGAIYNGGTLTLDHVAVSNSTAVVTPANYNGGGIANASGANLTIVDSTISGNTAQYGAGIYNEGAVTINRTTVFGNNASVFGGGLQNQGTASITNSTFYGNSGAVHGGAVEAANGTLAVANSTLARNSSPGTGGGIYVESGASGPVRLRNTLLALNMASSKPDIVGSITSQGYNLIGDPSGGAGFAATDLQNLDQGLVLLQNSPGPGGTLALLPGSRAIDAGNPAVPGSGGTACEATDQRGVVRPLDGNGDGTAVCDIGAFEYDPPQPGPTFTVNSAADPGDGLCTVGNCTLREAISAANSHPNAAGPDAIHFNIPGTGLRSISPLSPLAAITDSLIVDGYTQPGAASNTLASGSNATLMVEINGAFAGTTASGLVVTGGGTTIRGVVVNRFGQNGIVLSSSNNSVEGSFVGTDQAGAAALPNGASGVRIDAGSGNTVGGGDAAGRNVVSGNTGPGVYVVGGAGGNQVQNDLVGTNASGTAGLGNGLPARAEGIRIENSPGNTVRGNVVSGNGSAGLRILGAASSSNTAAGNLIGTDASGTSAVPNVEGGVSIQDAATRNTIGGGSGRNIISGNTGYGIRIRGNATENSLQANYVGTKADGTAALGNGTYGVLVDGGSNNSIGGPDASGANTVAFNRAVAVDVISGTGNAILGNAIYSNTLGIDLGGDGVTFNHRGDVAGPNGFQNYPVLDLAASDGSGTRVAGRLDSTGNTSFRLEFFANAACDPSRFGEGQAFLGALNVTTNVSGTAIFDQNLPGEISEPQGVSATATNLSTNSTSEFSYCRPASTTNLNWMAAAPLTLTETGTHTTGASVRQYIVDRFQEKWFKFSVLPGERVMLTYTGLPGSVLTLHRDPMPFYARLASPQDSAALSAEAADISFLPSQSLPSQSLPSDSLETGYLPSQSLPTSLLESGALPSQSLPSQSLPSQSLPSQSLPDGSLPAGTLPSQSLPSQSLPSQSLPSQSLPSQSLPTAYSGAARQSLMAISMDPYATVQSIDRETYDLREDLYVRVVGPYDITNPFTLQVTVASGVCEFVTPVPDSTQVISGSSAAAGSYRTLILTNSARLPGTPAEVQDALAHLQALAARQDVGGIVVDLSNAAYQRVAAAYSQADANRTCPTAGNIVADEIRRVVDAYRAANPTLEYVVLAGNNESIPYVQVPDKAGLAGENDYIPPVKPSTPSEAQLKSNLVQGQDAYGTRLGLSRGDYTFSVPDLAVGRLVETARDISTAVDVYTATNGIVTPHSALITGYDFVADAAQAIKGQVEAGLTVTDAVTADSLIQPQGEGPGGPNAWTADQLRAKLFAGEHDIISLSGHFSAGTLVAADYSLTRTISASEITASPVDLTNVVVMTLGCHGGYTIPGLDQLAGISPEPQFATAFGRKHAAAYIAATGYAYGDTELTEYGERLFVELSRQLRTGTGPVSIGKALVAAKRIYLAQTAQLTGIDEKTLVEMTLYGLPMMKIDMPGQRLTAPSDTSIVGSASPVASGPGAALGLQIGQPADGAAPGVVSVTPQLGNVVTETLQDLSNPTPGATVTASYMPGKDGVVANPFEPIFPKEIYNVAVPGAALRGVAFRGGSYVDHAPIIPLTGAPTTEVSRFHPAYNTDVFYPNQVWLSNYFDALTGGPERLVTVPAQYQSSDFDSITGTLRTYTGVQLQLYYLDANWPQTGSASVKAAAVAAAPTIFGASAVTGTNTLTFTAGVLGDASAGIQAVWVVYTARKGSSPLYGTWQSLDLSRPNPALDSSLWQGTMPMPAGTNASDIVFMVEAVNGTGRTTLSTNFGGYFTVGATALSPRPTRLALQTPPTTGIYRQPVTFNALLEYADSTSGAWQPLSNQTVVLSLGGQQARARTDATGHASIALAPWVHPGAYAVNAYFRGSPDYRSASAPSTFTVAKDTTSLQMSAPPATGQYSDPAPLTARLGDSLGRGLAARSVFFVVQGARQFFARSVITDWTGVASLGVVPLPAGSYNTKAYFGGQIPVSSSQTVTLSDDDYLPSQASASLAITPEDATVAYTGDTLVPISATIHLSATVTQAADGFPGDLTRAQVLFQLKDDAGSVVASVTAAVAANGTASATTPGLPEGAYRLEVTVVGGFFTSQATSAVLEVYAPAGSYVTGGGWIVSPAGAYRPNPSVTGRANFGFVAKSQKSPNTPTGNTTFQLQAGNMTFQATAYGKLTLSSPKAQFIGTGKINGGGTYNFTITVIDGQLTGGGGADKFRIKIWDSSGVVYDNQMGAPDSADPTTVISGGSIVIHS